MKTICKTCVATMLLSVAMPMSVIATELRSDYFYVGLDLGASIPAAKFFRDKDTDSVSRLTQSRMWGASVGYSFYPGMMIEFAMTHQPSYDFSYEIPVLDSTSHGSINAKIQSLFGNLIYQVPAKAFGLKPYIMAGVGVATIRTTPVVITATLYNVAFPIFTMDKSKGAYLTYHLGGGVTRDISKHLEIDFGIKLQIIQGVKFKYKAFSTTTFQLEKGDKKKTLVAGQFTIGLKINL